MALIRAHLDWFIDRAPLERHGGPGGAQWFSSLDLATGEPIRSTRRPAGIAKRCYRYIESPGGSNAYWDGPLLCACDAVSAVTGDDRYRRAAEGYLRDFLAHGTASNGLFLWGNHYFFDAASGVPVKFLGWDDEPQPVAADESGHVHETRPLSIPWALFARVDGPAVERCLAAQAATHVVDPGTGEFNRHADGRRGHAFLESGGILAEGLCWLAERTGDEALAALAGRIACFSFHHHDPITGLLSNSPTHDRWDRLQCTSEIGLWAGCLLRCRQRTGNEAFATMAFAALAAWLERAWDDEAEGFYGRLSIDAASPMVERTSAYQPGPYSDLWEPLFPAHDYPWQCAQACVELYRLTGEPIFERGLRRWGRVLTAHLPARDGRGAYAEHYGRALWLLLSAAEALDEPSWLDLADRVAAEALETLAVGDRFRTHPGEDRCDAVDGLGLLILALLWLSTGVRPALHGMGF